MAGLCEGDNEPPGSLKASLPQSDHWSTKDGQEDQGGDKENKRNNVNKGNTMRKRGIEEQEEYKMNKENKGKTRRGNGRKGEQGEDEEINGNTTTTTGIEEGE
ncbi:hypothetical protein ANN_07692 [Periplaneta americana]|uniref:Uncharacterized protein n=1 Tax=Periplaneta americana TaxID=6978 RepID=A0ABQ8T0U7_PERAM|nr:hypothetical protein ANN_07692 [Periplaneta americana]